MHCTLPTLPPAVSRTLARGARAASLAGGRLLARGMATAVELGFGALMAESLLTPEKSSRASAFVHRTFETLDPVAPETRSYYQGTFLLRTRKPGDDVNVLLELCPEPEKIFRDTPFGRAVDPGAVVRARPLSERRADRLERRAGAVDLVISFRDARSIVGLLGRPDLDVTGLLLDNVVEIRGNVGHLFKLGAIAANLEEELVH
jgi:hypothetical protein